MIKIEVTSESRTVNTKAGSSFQVQQGYAHLGGHKYPQAVEIIPPRGAGLYAPGMYTLDPTSLYIDRYGSLAIRPVLRPVQQPAVASSAKA